MESEVLPRYFNHASFASLRRQLNYFSFTRIGKGRQRGATYCNEGVVELHDILRLKRRGTGAGGGTTTTPTTTHLAPAVSDESANQNQFRPVDDHQHHHQTAEVSSSSSSGGNVDHEEVHSIINSVVPVVHLPSKKKKKRRTLSTDGSTSIHNSNKNKGSRRTVMNRSSSSMSSTMTTRIISPLTMSSHDDELRGGEPHITLDLTIPYHPSEHEYVVGFNKRSPSTTTTIHRKTKDEEEMLAGCSALLSFATR